jgi:hypothetical protein
VRQPKKPKPVYSLPVEIEHNGTKYSGTYTLEGQIVTVNTLHGSKSGRLGALDPERIARQLLWEIVGVDGR